MQEIQCVKCRWQGRVVDCESSTPVGDEPTNYTCPKCGERLAVQGWLDCGTIEGSAHVIETGVE